MEQVYHVGFIGIAYDLTVEDVWGDPDVEHQLPANYKTQVSAIHEEEAVDLALELLSDETGYLVNTIDQIEVYVI